GPVDGVEKFRAELRGTGIESRPLHTSRAFHSPMMEPVLDAFVACFKNITLSPPTIPYVSNVTGDWITSRGATDPAYWAQHLRQTVRFSQGFQTLLDT